MIILRILAILIGSAILFGAPFFLLPETPQSRPDDFDTVIVNCLSLVLVVSGYFFVGVLGHRMRKSLRRRLVAAVLLVFPFIASGYVLFSGKQTDLLPAIVPLFCFTAFLYIAFVFPSNRRRTARALRPREESDQLAPSPIESTQAT